MKLRRRVRTCHCARRVQWPWSACILGPPLAVTVTIDKGAYRQWIERFDSFDAADLRAATEYGRSLVSRPRFDVVMPVHDPPLVFLQEAIASIRAQTYDDWRLCIVDDASAEQPVRRALERAAFEDPRVLHCRSDTQLGIAGATNRAFGLSSAAFVVFFDHDDVLPPHALLTVADRLVREPTANLLYSDFDFLDESGSRINPFFKPDYDHDFHLGLNLVSNLTIYRRSVLAELGGFREGFRGSEDYDLALRAVEVLDERTIVHIPHVLYHWRIVQTSATKTRLGAAVEAARRAVSEHCARRGVPALVSGTSRSMIWNRVRAVPAVALRVTIAVIGATESVRREATARLRARSEYDGVSFADLDAAPIGVARNALLRSSDSELLAFVGADLVPRDSGWLQEMASHFADPGVGAVGARIVGPNGSVQHSGIVLGVGEQRAAASVAMSAVFAGIADADANYFGRAEIAHRMLAVAGGVIIVRKSALERVGGFDESIADPALLDIDVCLRLRGAGFSVVLNPNAVFEAPERALSGTESTAGLPPLASFAGDPYYNPNLSGAAADFSLAFPPRVRFPWRGAPPEQASEP